MVDFTRLALLIRLTVAETDSALIAAAGTGYIACQTMLYAAATPVPVSSIAFLTTEAILVVGILAILAAILALLASVVDSEAPTGFAPVAATFRRADAPAVRAANASIVRCLAESFCTLLAR